MHEILTLILGHGGDLIGSNFGKLGNSRQVRSSGTIPEQEMKKRTCSYAVITAFPLEERACRQGRPVQL
jgi:hypothetical protein